MTNDRKMGKTGLSILDVTPSNPPKKKKTPEEIAKWCATLPMADTGVSAKKLFMMLDEISRAEMTAKERFAVMELLRAPNKAICTALKRHYIEQRAPLTEHKLIIANLRQTLLTAMGDNYKLILEYLHEKGATSDEDRKLIATTIVRILYYLNVILICRYQLYTYPPEGIWHEVNLLYKYAKERGILNLKVNCQFAPSKQITTILESYTRIIMLYATDPYQWRQREQHSLNKAIELWTLFPIIYEHSQIPHEKVGVYIVDLDMDGPPTLSNFRNASITPSCIAFDLSKCVDHLKSILEKMKDNHLKAKIEHPNDPEFSVTAPTIAKLIKIWSQHITRSSQRLPITAQIKIAFGLTAAHYYINDEKEFNQHPANLRTSFGENETARPLSASATLPVFEVSEEIEEDEEPERLQGTAVEESKDNAKTQAEQEERKEAEANREALYHLYNYNIENISHSGFCIIIRDKTYPPFQAGEIVVFKNTSGEDLPWGLGSVRWLRRKNDDEFQIGIQLIAPYAKAAGIQMLNGDKPANRLLRCLVLPESTEHKIPPMLITTAFPINSNTVMLYMDDAEPLKAQLTREIDASGMYYQYVYTTEGNVDITKRQDKKKEEIAIEQDDGKTNTEFDSIWGDL